MKLSLVLFEISIVLGRNETLSVNDRFSKDLLLFSIKPRACLKNNTAFRKIGLSKTYLWGQISKNPGDVIPKRIRKLVGAENGKWNLIIFVNVFPVYSFINEPKTWPVVRKASFWNFNIIFVLVKVVPAVIKIITLLKSFLN